MLTPAAQYLRMSTEHQQYSLVNQAALIASYAIDHHLEIVRTYVDEGRSGLVLKERKGLQQLLRDVVSPDVTFKTVLVYDVSRWGRFQDTDESAHYEFIWKSSGVPVCYCAETFENNNSIPNLIMKNLKRAMAGEYSRELSIKVYEGQKRLVKLGFSTGGMPGYGFRRMLVSSDKKPKHLLGKGERKALQSDHVILVHGPKQEVEVVREIYRLAIEQGIGASRIAAHLNEIRVPFTDGGSWYSQAVARILTHPRYMGSQVFGRKSVRLHTGTTYYPRENWLVVPNTHEPIVTKEIYDQAQAALRNVTRHKSNDTLLEEMRSQLTKKRGRFSLSRVARSPNHAGLATYIKRFGSTRELCKLLGIDHEKEFQRAACRINRMKVRQQLMDEIEKADPTNVRVVRADVHRKNFLKLRRRGSVAVVGCHAFKTKSGQPRWLVCPAATDKKRNRPYLLCLFNRENTQYERFYLVKSLRTRRQYTLRPDDEYLASGIRLRKPSDLFRAVAKLNGNSTRKERLSTHLR